MSERGRYADDVNYFIFPEGYMLSFYDPSKIILKL